MHVRHVLQHFNALLLTTTALVDYDNRPRLTLEETDPTAALSALDSLLDKLSTYESSTSSDLSTPISIKVTVDTSANDLILNSSFARELWFVCPPTPKPLLLF
ncbi:hypothetical protein HK098_006023 [Nowakowskiella sp. JEL0407]|nr:hypothetical protein HK098_006023 [Nowakowskiella sp. JEL0407]